MKLDEFSFDLPQDRIAREPASPRESAKLLLCSSSDPGWVEHRRISELPEILCAGDLLVLNETKVLPHRLLGYRAFGGKVECLILARDGENCRGYLRPSARLRVGERLQMEGGALELEIGEKLGAGLHAFRLCAPGGGDPAEALEAVGRAPLPPYIERQAQHEDVQLDRSRYQTVFAKQPGAVAAPTAGLHFSEALLQELAEQGIPACRLCLHVGQGSFEPIRVAHVEEHRMHEEAYELPQEAADAISSTRARGKRVVCVGTTSLRVLETCHDRASNGLHAGAGSTGIYLYPGQGPRFVDSLLTNFHLPKSSLFLLVASMLGRERALALYELAIAKGYRFYSFGDAMLILP